MDYIAVLLGAGITLFGVSLGSAIGSDKRRRKETKDE